MTEIADINKLWRSYRNNPASKAYEQLVEVYLPLALKEVERYVIRTRHFNEKNDLVGVAVVGLHKALRQFDSRQGQPFENYARQRIKGTILDEMRKRDHLTRPQRKRYHAICKIIKEYSCKHSELPSYAHIAKELDCKEDDVSSIIAMAGVAFSLDDEERRDNSLQIRDELQPTPDQACINNMSKEEMRLAFRQLPEKDQQLLYLRHYKEMKVTEVAEAMNISPGRVSQLYRECLGKMRALMGLEQ